MSSQKKLFLCHLFWDFSFRFSNPNVRPGGLLKIPGIFMPLLYYILYLRQTKQKSSQKFFCFKGRFFGVPPQKKRTTATCSTFAVWRPSDLPHVSGARWLSFCSWQRWGLGSCHRGRRIIPRDLDQPQPEKPKEFLVGNLPWIFFGESNPFWPGFSNFERFFFWIFFQ